MFDEARRARAKNQAQVPEKVTLHHGYQVQVNGSVRVPNRPGYVWVQDIYGNTTPMLNPNVQDRPNLPIRFRKMEHGSPVIERVDWELLSQSSEYTGEAYLRNHARDHEWRRGYPGPDALTIYPDAMYELRTAPFDGLEIVVSGMFYFDYGAPVTFRGGVYDLSSYVPSAGNSVQVMVSYDFETRAMQFTSGSEISTVAIVSPPYPTRPARAVVSAYVRLASDTITIDWSLIKSARTFLNVGDNTMQGDANRLRDFLLMGA
jgi:hypothetical protein